MEHGVCSQLTLPRKMVWWPLQPDNRKHIDSIPGALVSDGDLPMESRLTLRATC